MKNSYLIFSTLVAILFLGSMQWSSCSSKKMVSEASTSGVENTSAEAVSQNPHRTAQREEPAFITAIKEKIKGKEEMPAEEVFGNIQILKGMPAGRVLPIMQMAFSRSLGVKCSHCHARGDWASDELPQKNVAREMWAMTSKINQELLSSIDNLQGPQTIVNCTTCHRGERKPALNIGQ